MDKISREQKNLLQFLKAQPPFSPFAIRRIFRFISNKPEDEPLDPQWEEVWEKYREDAREELPSRIFEKIERTISQFIQSTEDEIWTTKIKANTKITFLLGAGASAPSEIPTVDKLLPELWKRAKKIGREDLDRLAEWCNEREINNIEDLLTAAYISNFAARNPNIISLLDYFIFSGSKKEEEYIEQLPRPLRSAEIDVSSINFLQDTLQTLFGLLTSTMISANPNSAHQAIVDFIKNRKCKNTSIITTNYDGCMDEAMLKGKIPFKGTISGENENNPDAVPLIKMHGSINWAYCDSCQDVKEFNLLEVKKNYEEDKISYPVIGICKKCGGLRRPLLVPPLSFKFLMFPNLIDIWNSARQSIEEADYLIIVGYSFSEADTYITKIISRSMAIKPSQKMIIVNINNRLVETLRGRFSTYIDGFDEKRILKVGEDCKKILPKILKSMLDEKSPKNNSKSLKKRAKKSKSEEKIKFM